jgi:hypothetical protein
MDGLVSGGVLNWVWRIAAVLLGGAGGFAYYKFVGCKTGMCPITSNPWLSTLYGAVLAALVVAR